MSFLTQINSYIGTFSDVTSLDGWLTQGAKNIINMLPENILKQYATNLTISNSGLSTSGYKVYRIHYNGYGSMEYPIDKQAFLQDPNSMYYATPTSPAHIYDNALLFIFPSGGIALAMKYPTVMNTDNTITNFPPELTQGVVLYASIQATIQNINTAKSSLASLTIPVAPSAPSFSYSTQTDTIDISADLTLLATYIDTDEDVELATAKINEIAEKIKQFVEQTQFAIAQAKETTNVSVQQYSATLQKYSGDLNSFGSQLQQFGNEFQELNSLLQSLKNEYADILKSNGIA